MATPKKLNFPKRKKKNSRQHNKMGKAPGTISYMGNKELKDSVIINTTYSADKFQTKEFNNLVDFIKEEKGNKISWVNVVGISDEPFIEQIGKHYNLNPLVLEDIVNTEQRPKVDEYDGYIFGVFRMLYISEEDEIVGEHVALVLLENTVLVFQEVKEDVFNGVRERINGKLGRIRTRGADYLFFALLDAIVDNYFLAIENLNNRIEVLEEEVYQNPEPIVAKNIQELKKEILKIRRWIYPVKELISRLIDSENTLITKDTKLFLRDALDHAIEINESLQIYREMSMSLMEMYMSNMSNKMNEVMKVLTIMASIFIPLTFIAGIYGMNFDYMPELHIKNGYFYVWGVMIALFIGMMIYFKKKKWL
ncbi:magnesium/cobalt transporter CorA [Maribacter hydrothermalis]|uniref:Magnesium transport protein CorA n=1 Tax=Maribacter hydrothermalis TaxID=1836467 RepID=A0A1B7Z8L7_9FLAO|nr:magnesium/cobalt transporter CorA [Maribacter hydrothermalis]APQ18930.1 magnesium and cobalt transport protein CorA [Maribacter hydrothermalis]OBR39057.1 magnesium and cobalt transport protein CorA [Maribacter hydrothermalis]